MIHSITRAMLQEEYWKDMDTPQLVHLRQAIQLDAESLRRGMRGCSTVEEYAINVPELVARTNAISKLTERISGFYKYTAHCPKCWRGVNISNHELTAGTLYLFGHVVGRTGDQRCRQCRGVWFRWS